MIAFGKFRKLVIASAALVGVLGLAQSASASTWAETHPRRVEVNHRLDRHSVRIAKAQAAGKVSPAKAARLDRKDARIRREERTMASLNHGHITKAEKKALNQQENTVGKQIP